MISRAEMMDIAVHCAEAHGYGVESIIAKCRRRSVVCARAVAYCALRYAGCSMLAIAGMFDVHHTTVVHLSGHFATAEMKEKALDILGDMGYPAYVDDDLNFTWNHKMVTGGTYQKPPVDPKTFVFKPNPKVWRKVPDYKNCRVVLVEI